MNTSADRRLRWLATAGSPFLLLASLAYAIAGGATPAELVAVVVVAGSFLVAGIAAWARRPANRTGRLLVAAGLCELLVPLVGPPWLVLAPVGHVAGTALVVILAQLILSFPAGELPSTASRTWVVAIGVLTLIVRTGILVSLDPATRGWTADNPYRIIRDPGVAATIEAARLALVILIVTVLMVLVVARWVRATGPARRAFSPVLVAGAAAGAIYLAGAIAGLGTIPAELKTTLLWSQDLALAFFPMGFLAGFLRIYLVRSAIADLVVELGETPTPAQLRAALANALGDPTLAVAYWSAAEDAYVGTDGAAVVMPGEGSGRAVTRLERGGTPIAAIIHDPALLDDPRLVASVASAMRLAVENEHLQAAVEDQLEEVRASRARIVEAGDAERRRLERDLHDGAQQRLVSLALALRVARTRLGGDADPAIREMLEQAADDARQALVELRELARGIHPAVLTEAGLGAAVESLADRSAVPVRVLGATGERLSPVVERAAYFVVSEALANVNKHAGATRATVLLARDHRQLTVEVHDDGIGGVDTGLGTGLRGLADRVAAVDGTLTIDSPPGGGTRLQACIPLGKANGNSGARA
jgi:signal transduction histidine kinase